MILTSLSPQLFLYQEKPPFYVGGLYYESMTRMSSRQTHLLKGENLLLIIIVILNSLRFHHLGSLEIFCEVITCNRFFQEVLINFF